MKFKNILKYLLPIFLSSSVFAQDFYTYELFDNKFQAAYPGEPSISPGSPQVINGVRLSSYHYSDPNNIFFIFSNSHASSLDKNITIYKKSGLDKLVKTQEKTAMKATPGAADYSLMSFSSEFDRKKNAYIAVYTFSISLNGSKVYKSTKYIVQNQIEYKLSVMYFNLSDKYIFDDYKQYAKVLK